MSDKQYSYIMNGKPWTQRPLVLGQWKQLVEILKGLAIPAGSDISGLIGIVGARLPFALAVVLIEEGGDLRRRFGIRTVDNGAGVGIPEWYQNPEVMLEIANEIEAGIDAETAMRVVDDFLSCNPVSSILERLAGIMGNATRIRQTIATASTPSAPVSPEETSPDGIKSSGDTHQKSASPTSEPESGKASSESP